MPCAAGCGSSHGPCCGRPARHDIVLRRSSTGVLARLCYPLLTRPPARLSARRPPTFQLTHPLARHPPCSRSSIHPCITACTRACVRPRTHSSIRPPLTCLPTRLLVFYLTAGPPARSWARTSAPSYVLLPARTPTRGHAHALPSACATTYAPIQFIVCLRASPPPASACTPTSHRCRRHRSCAPRPAAIPPTPAAAAAAASSNIPYHWIWHVQLDR